MQSKHILRTIKSIAREFAIPFIAAATWTTYSNLESLKQLMLDPKLIITTFTPAFFVTSWALGQILRIHKQNRIDDELRMIRENNGDTTRRIETVAEELSNQWNGGNSFPQLIFVCSQQDDQSGTLIATNTGKYALHGVTASIIDIEKFQRLSHHDHIKRLRESTVVIQIGEMAAEHGQAILDIRLNNEEINSYNVTFTARNGRFTQLMRFRRVNGDWKYATKILRGENILHESTQEGFPRTAGEVSW